MINSDNWIVERNTLAYMTYAGYLDGKDFSDVLKPVVEEHYKTALPYSGEFEILIAVLYPHYVSVTVKEGEKIARMIVNRDQFERMFAPAIEKYGKEQIVSPGGFPGIIVRPWAKTETLQ